MTDFFVKTRTTPILVKKINKIFTDENDGLIYFLDEGLAILTVNVDTLEYYIVLDDESSLKDIPVNHREDMITVRTIF